MKRIYLVGVISDDGITHDWRKEATKLLGDKFEIDNPVKTRFDQAAINNEVEKKIMSKRAILLPKSLQSVEMADIILVNLGIYEKGHAGHIMEIAWAYYLNKTIVAIKGDSVYYRHPMIRGAVTVWCETVEESCHVIKEFFT